MQRPAAIVGDVVRDVDERVDRAQPDRLQPVLQPRRRRTVLDASDDAAGEHGTRIRRLGRELQFDRIGQSYACLRRSDLRLGLQCAEPGRCEIARNAAHARAVRTVRRQLHFEDRIVEAGDVDVAFADLVGPFRRQIENAVALFRKLKFGGRAHHAVRNDTAHRLLLKRDLRAGNVRAERREHSEHAGARVRRAADDFHQRLALGDLDLHDLQLVGVWMLLGFDDARDRECAERLRRIFDAFDLEPDRRQLRRDLIDRGLRVEMILEPGEREFHLFAFSSTTRRRASARRAC